MWKPSWIAPAVVESLRLSEAFPLSIAKPINEYFVHRFMALTDYKYAPLTYIRYWRTLHHGLHRNTIFTRQVVEALTDELYGLLQASLLGRPDAGDLIKGGGGIRKLRWALPGRGKRGGVRVVYFWRVTESQIMMLTMYAKNEQTNLTPAQVKQLAKLVEALK
jgi:hypothetical protein